MPARSAMCISAAAMLVGAGSALAGPNERLRRIEQGVADSDTRAVSRRVMNPDLHEPAGFWQLYEDTENPGSYVRVNGATYAVMPYTEYAMDEDDNIITRVPAGTVFYLGGLPTIYHPPAPEPSRNVSTTRAMAIRYAVPTSDIMLAQLATRHGERAVDKEFARASDQRQRAARINDGATSPDDMSDERVRAARLWQISTTALHGE